MAGKVRVYELARELGLTNKETLDLCEALGIGVKSHSSSVVEPQADRVRRKAEREGLIREEQPEEAKAKKTPPNKAAAAETEPVADAPVAEPSEPAKTARPVDAVVAEPKEASADEPAPAPPPPAPPPPRPPSRRVVTSSGSAHPPRPVPEPLKPVVSTPPPAPAPPAASTPPAAEAEAEVEVEVEAETETETEVVDPESSESPTSSGDEDDSAEPRPPTSGTGKPIPPPPGMGGRGPAPSGPRSGGPGRPSGGGSGGGGGGGGAGAPRPGGGTPPRSGGPPGRGRPPQGRRRKSRRRRKREELQPMGAPSYTPVEAPVPSGEILLERSSTPQELGPHFNRTAADVVRFLMQQGEMVTATQSLTDDMIELFAAEIGAAVRLVDPGEEQEVELQKQLGIEEIDLLDDDDVSQEDRPPVITVMGHVDHGKTKLLDQIRNANVVDGEAGGITQHIGAYQAEHNGHQMTFIDTPGHEAFTAMRARGADATDIVILVVAADDGMMPQTVEALNHAKAADVPIIVAINKIDRENANIDRVRQQMAEHDLVPEEWGGDTISCEISALNNIGIDDLLDNILVLAEVEDLSANPDGRARGVVLESHLDKGRGPVATILVQRGTLSVGEPLVAGHAWGRVRALINDQGQQVKTAPPSTPVQVLGLSDVAVAGDDFVVAPDEKVASKVADTREHYERVATMGRDGTAVGGARLEDIFAQIQAGENATLALIVKADVNGSLEALTDSLLKLERPEVKLSFVHRGVGGITENDIQLAGASNATIIGFNVRPDRKARELAEAEQVEIRNYEIIYEVLDDIDNAMKGLLAPEYEEIVTGDAEVREIFSVPRIGKVAGCYVQNGTITRGSKVRFLREGTIIWKGAISSLRRFKDDVREVQAGFECGIGLSDFQDLKGGDVIETYEDREIPIQ